MNKLFKVKLEHSASWEPTIEANTPEEALKEALQMLQDNNGYDWHEMNMTNQPKIKEVQNV